MAIPPTETVQVVIVGAGLSGLRAAREVDEAGLSYVVLEAAPHVGGKTLSVPAASNGTGGVIDMGAAWLNDTSQSEMYGLAKEYGFDLIEQPTDGTSLYRDPEGQVHSIPQAMTANVLPEQVAEVEQLFRKLTEYTDRSDLEYPHRGPDAADLDSMTMLELAERLSRGDLAKRVVNNATRMLLGVDSHELSALYCIDTWKRGGGIEKMLADGKGGGQNLRNRQGNQSFCLELAARLRPGSVKVSTAVTSITQTDQGCIIGTSCGSYYHAARVIVSVPSVFYPLFHFEPALPAAKKLLGESGKLGYYSKTALVFAEAWWKAARLSGTYSSADGVIGFACDTCVPVDGQFSITCFHVGEAGRRWSLLTGEERRDAVLGEFRAAFGTVVECVPDPINVVEKEWTRDDWAQGAPVPVMMPGTMTSEAGKSLCEPFRNIHFVGTETALVYRGYMEGAVRSGIRGAREVIAALQ